MAYRELVQDLIQSAEADRDRIMAQSRESAREIISRSMEAAEKNQVKFMEGL